MTNIFQQTLKRQNESSIPPVWFMRQAGRYHRHFQELRKKHSFVDFCKIPEIACAATMGPMRDFDFDAAILFSDLAFPLEYLKMGLEFSPGPKLEWYIRNVEDCERFRGISTEAASIWDYFKFQKCALKAIRSELPKEKGLIGFVGGPLTLYYYAVAGKYSGDLSSAKRGFTDGRFERFNEKIIPIMVENILLQAEADPDCIVIIDTSAGENTLDEYREFNVPTLKAILDGVRKKLPYYPILYYSKGTSFDHWDLLTDLPLNGIGVDWKTSLKDILDRYSERFVIQGNVDPQWMAQPWTEVEPKLREFFAPIQRVPQSKRSGWVCGLGHGLTPQSREENVRNFVKLVREIF